MTQFEPVPSMEAPQHYRMSTYFPEEAANVLDSIHRVGGLSITEGVRRAVGVHKMFTDSRAAGEGYMIKTSGLEPFPEPRTILRNNGSPRTDNLRRVIVNVSNDMHSYLLPHATGKDTDLLPFWNEAVGIMSKLGTMQVLGHQLLRLDRYNRITIAEWNKDILGIDITPDDSPSKTSPVPGSFMNRLFRKFGKGD